MDNKAARFFIALGLALGLIIAMFVVIGATDLGPDEFMVSGLGFVGAFFFYIAYDMLGDCDDGFGFAMRVLCCVLGIILIAGGMIFAIVYSVTNANAYPNALSCNVGAMALGNCWFLAGTVAILLFVVAHEHDWDEAILPFIPTIAFVASFVICILFSYFATAWGIFFYLYAPFIVGLIVTAVIIVLVLKYRGASFAISRGGRVKPSVSLPTTSRVPSTSAPVRKPTVPKTETAKIASKMKGEDNSDEKNAADAKYNQQIREKERRIFEGTKELEARLQRKICSAWNKYLIYGSIYWEDPPTFSIYGAPPNLIRWSGKLRAATLQSPLNTPDRVARLQKQLRETVRRAQKTIINETKQVFQAVQAKYPEFNGVCQVDTQNIIEI